MMCSPCKQAGKLLSSPHVVSQVAAVHKLCEAPATCTCQHWTESVVKK